MTKTEGTSTMDQTRLTSEDVSDYLKARGVSILPATWRAYVGRRKAPSPQDYLGRTPWWTPAQVDAWLASRPGQGAGGGRPVGFSPKRQPEPEPAGASA